MSTVLFFEQIASKERWMSKIIDLGVRCNVVILFGIKTVDGLNTT